MFLFPGLKNRIRSLELENADLMFLNAQYLQKIAQLEKEAAGKNELLLALQSSKIQAIVRTTGTDDR